MSRLNWRRWFGRSDSQAGLQLADFSPINVLTMDARTIRAIAATVSDEEFEKAMARWQANLDAAMPEIRANALSVEEAERNLNVHMEWLREQRRMPDG